MGKFDEITNVANDVVKAYRKLRSQKMRIEVKAVNFTQAKIKRRIFLQGKDSRNGRIGSYSRKPYYASKGNSQVRSSSIKPRGKNGQSKFKNGRVKKTRYLAGGYAEFRQLVGRQNSYVDLELTGELRRSIKTISTSGGTALRITGARNQIIAGGVEEKYNKDIFDLTQQEINQVDALVEKEVDTLIFNALGL